MDLKAKAGKVNNVQQYLKIGVKATKTNPTQEEGVLSKVSPSTAFNLVQKKFVTVVEEDKKAYDEAVVYLKENGIMPKFGTTKNGKIQKEESK